MRRKSKKNIKNYKKNMKNYKLSAKIKSVMILLYAHTKAVIRISFYWINVMVNILTRLGDGIHNVSVAKLKQSAIFVTHIFASVVVVIVS